MLTAGTQIALAGGGFVVVEAFLGSGGQGEVYRVKAGIFIKALKWYTDPSLLGNNTFMAGLRGLVDRGAPSPYFIWPQAIALGSGRPHGYVMPLRPDNFHDLGDFFCVDRNPGAYFTSYAAKVNAAMQICDAFRLLHQQGYSYQDLNDGNFFINPDSGDVRICDNDNVTLSGTDTGVRGKPHYMAPEVCEGAIPTSASDRLSLAIVLYRIFMVDHPYEGRLTARLAEGCITPDVERRSYGHQAVFCYDASDCRNRPEASLQPNSVRFWASLPVSLQAMFRQALSHVAIAVPAARVSAARWLHELAGVRAHLHTCNEHRSAPTHDFFGDAGAPAVCPRCGMPLRRYGSLTFADGSFYRLGPGKPVYADDSFEPVAKCKVVHSDCFLENISMRTWTVALRHAPPLTVPPRQFVPLYNGLKIDFGNAVAVVSIPGN